MAAAARRTWPVAPVSCCGGSGTIWTATPIVYNSGDYQISGSGFDLHLFTGQQWYSQLGLYDLRNRFYSPDIGRFLQPDPIGFWGDPTNLYRYCGNNPVKWRDPGGLQDDSEEWGKFTLKTENVVVFGTFGGPTGVGISP